MSMSDHTKAISRFVEDARQRHTELENQVKGLEKNLTLAKSELELMKNIVTNNEAFLNLTNAASGGQSAIVMPEKFYSGSK